MRREGGVKKWGIKVRERAKWIEGKGGKREGRWKGAYLEGRSVMEAHRIGTESMQREKKEENGDRDLHSASVLDTYITQRAESLTCTSCADHNHSLLPVMYFLNRQKHLFDVHTSNTCIKEEGESERGGGRAGERRRKGRKRED